ncbi:MAG: hypothetical protein V3T05_03375, partial [Myxococcota bacterium]
VAWLTIGSVASAQEPAKLQRVEVALWPEYDEPSVLVIVRVWLPPDATMPASVPISIPASVGMPHAVAKRALDGTLHLAPHTREVKDDRATITIVTDRPEIRVEYYAALTINGAARSFSFPWHAAQEVGQFAYEVQQPHGATELTIEPPSTKQAVGADGLTYHHASLGALAAGRTIDIELGYNKTTASLTVAALQPAALPGQISPGVLGMTTPAGSGAPASDDNTSTWIVVVLIGILVAIGGVWLALGGSKDEKPGGTSKF